ncbi:MAG TPA: hypothetical protein VFN75_04710 [Pseudonocardiaceae bacterium]|nr:hypothetical protein [Pseudonocardiaceae bacterium]
MLLSILLAAVVTIVALVVIYLGPIDATAVLTGVAGGGYGESSGSSAVVGPTTPLRS